MLQKILRTYTTLQTTDTISSGKTLNDIRFKDWDRSDWLDNEYIRTLRKYLDDYNKGISVILI